MFTSRQDSYIEGDIKSIATRFYEELYTTGYSLLESDVERIITDVCRDYLAWGGALRAYDLDDKDDTYTLLLDSAINIYNDEWSIIRPVVVARCDLMQAKRMEGAQNLGVQPVGMGSSEAYQNHREAMLEMKREAFNTHPFSVDSTADLEGKNQTNNTADLFQSIQINYNGWWK